MKRQGLVSTSYKIVSTLVVLMLVIANMPPAPALSAVSESWAADFDSLNKTSLPLTSSTALPEPTAPTRVKQSLEGLPLYFVENQGQLDESVFYSIQGADKTIHFTAEGVAFVLAGQVTAETRPSQIDDQPVRNNRDSSTSGVQRWTVKLDFVGANPNVRPQGQAKTEAVVSYFKGSREHWQAGLPTYNRIVYSNLWPGIDLVYYGTVDQLKYEFVIHPGADPQQIRLAYRGADLSLDSTGRLQVTTPIGSFGDDAPVAYQEIDGRQVDVTASYALDQSDERHQADDPQFINQDSHTYTFDIGRYDPTRPLILDPAILIYCGYVGGTWADWSSDIAVDSAGNAYIVGTTQSAEDSFPVVVGPDLSYNQNMNGGDAFVAKINAAGTALIYAGYIGGARTEWGQDIAVDTAGNAYITGETESFEDTFPLVTGPDLTYNGSSRDAFVTKINAAGTALVYSGYIGGLSAEEGNGIAVDGAGNAYIVGYTFSTQSSFPVTVGPDLTFNSIAHYESTPEDAFVAKINAAGTALVYAGYIGGSEADYGRDIAVDSAGNAYVVGDTGSTQTSFPVQGGPDLSYNGTYDAFVAKVNAAGTALVYAGYIGGSGFEEGDGIAVDGAGNTYLAGRTTSTEASFPVTVGPDLTYNGNTDVFVAKLNPAGTAFDYAGYVGGSGEDRGAHIAIDGARNAYIVGTTNSTEATFPVVGGPDLTYNGGGSDAFVAEVNKTGAALVYAGYIGGDNQEGWWLDFNELGIAADVAGNAYVVGTTASTQATLPVIVGPDLTYNSIGDGSGSYDVFVAKIQATTSTYSASGRVLDSNNAPIANVTVSDGAGHTTITDSDGNYTLNGLEAGAHTLVPAHDSYTFEPDSHTISVPPDVANQDFIGTLLPHSISGQVTDNTGAPLAGVNIFDASGRSTTTGSNGYYSLRVGVGTHTLTAAKSGYTFAPNSLVIDTPPDATGQNFVGTPLPYTISGRVTNNDDVPIADVTISDDNGHTTTTNPDGTYALHVDVGAYTLTASKRDYNFSPPSRFISVPPDAIEQDFVGTPPGTISGRVTDNTHASIPYVTVVISDGIEQKTTTTDGEGRYTFAWLPAGTYTIQPSKNYHIFSPAQRIVNVPPDQPDQDFTGFRANLRLTVSPNYIAADGVATATVALIGAPANYRVRFDSTRGSVDIFDSIAGTTDTDGALSTTIRSFTPGTSILTVQDLSTGVTLDASTEISFADPNEPDAINIIDIKSERPLDDKTSYLAEIPVSNRIDVTVDWKNTPPDRVDFILNEVTYSEPASSSKVSHTFDMGRDLRSGRNHLRIVAYNTAQQASRPHDFTFFSVPLPLWLLGLQRLGLMSLPILATGDWNALASYQAGFHFPAGDSLRIEADNFGVPEKTQLEWSLDGKLAIPLNCGTPLEASISAGVSKEMGRTPSGFTFLGTNLEGTVSGGWLASRTPTCGFNPREGFAALKLAVTRTIYSKPILLMLARFNPLVAKFVDEIVQGLKAEHHLAKLGELYVDGRAHFDVTTVISLTDKFPHLSFKDLSLGGGLGIEAGIRADLTALEVKIWAGADGSITFTRKGLVSVGPIMDNWKFDSIGLRGEVGANIRALWVEHEVKDSIEWTYPPTTRATTSLLPNSLAVDNWSLIGHASTADYAMFRALPGTRQPLSSSANRQSTNLAALATVTSVLVSNVYTYPEPSLALNPTTNNALLLWVHDDIAKPVGQAHEIYYSRWNGSAWSTPTGVTNDNRLDGAPQVAWVGNGNGVAVWQRLNATLPITATWDVTTAKKIEIATSVYSPTAGTWSPATLLTNNTALDMIPRLSRNANGQLLAAWVQNPAGQLGGTTSAPDRIMTAFYNNGWGTNNGGGTPIVAVDNIVDLAGMAIGYGNNAALLAYTRDFTPTGSVTPALQLFTSSWNGMTWSAPVQQTDDDLGHRNPQIVYNSTNQPLLIWLAGNELRLRNLTTSSTTSLPLTADLGIDELRVVQDATGNVAAIFTAQNTQRDLYLTFYDQPHNVWGQPKPLTNDRASEIYPAAALDSSGRLLMSYAATAITSITRTSTIPGTGEVVTYTIPADGQTDLLTLSHEFEQNLTLDSLTVSTDHPAPGSSVVLSATVRNGGDRALNSVTVGFYDGDPAAGGALIRTATLPDVLAGGVTATLTTTYDIPFAGSQHTLYAVADPANSIAESNEADNVATLAAFGPDLEIVDAGVDYWGGSDVGLVSLIRNIGTTESPATSLAFYRNTFTGTLVVTDALPPLAAGQSITLTTAWNFGALSEGVYPMVVAVDHHGSEVFTANNILTFTLDVRPDVMVSPYSLQTTSPTATHVLITGTVYNIGPVTATNVTVAFHRNPALLETTLLFTRTIPTLRPASAVIITSEMPGPFVCGVYLLVDSRRTITETTYENNLAGTLVEDGRCASFWATPTTGPAPLTVAFTSTTNSITGEWLWDFGDGITSTLPNPLHEYVATGAYTVTLTVSGTSGADTLTRANYVIVTKPVASISLDPVSKNWESVHVGELSPAQSFTISNTGSADLLVQSAVLTGANASEFIVTGDTCSNQAVKPWAHCTIEVIFAPTMTGEKQASLVISSNDPVMPTVSAELSGSGIEPPPPPTVGCRVARGASQSLGNGQATAIAFDTQINDVTSGDNCWTPAEPSRLYARESGYYLAGGAIALNPSSWRSGKMAVIVQRGGGSWIQAQGAHLHTVDDSTYSVMTGMFYLNAGEYIEILGYHTLGDGIKTYQAAGCEHCVNGWLMKIGD